MDLLLLANLLPHLPDEANLTSSGSPVDHHCMLIQGASVVQFANSFVDAYSMNKTFISVAVFICAKGLIDQFCFSFHPQLLLPDCKVCMDVPYI